MTLSLPARKGLVYPGPRDRRPPYPVFVVPETIEHLGECYATAWLPNELFQKIEVTKVEVFSKACGPKLLIRYFNNGIVFRFPYLPEEESNLFFENVKSLVQVFLSKHLLSVTDIKRIFDQD